jgi:ankyrin repeat protein
MDTFPLAVRRVLDDLPQGLDETYDRILRCIPKRRQKFARRLFACLAVSIRPLDIEELAEILAIEFDAGPSPSYDVNWRPEDPEEAVLSACSSLITIVNVDGSRVVQFSHFSVKEYLTSERLANATHLSQFHILPHSAHTILAQASLGALLALDDKVNKEMMKKYQLAIYAARYWVDHARFEDVSLGVNDAMKRLFDATKPHFAAWVWIYDIDFPSREIMFTAHPTTPEAIPLYYATLCGFGDIVKHLIVTCPQDINARGGLHTTPLYAAVVKGNVDIMTLFAENGADVNALNPRKESPLHEASKRGRHEMMELLLNHHSDINAQDNNGFTALHLASRVGELDAVRILLRHGTTVGSRDNAGGTPLIFASQNGHLDIVQMLLKNSVTVDSHYNNGCTSLMFASQNGHSDIVRMLLENGATADSHDNTGWTSLMSASQNGHSDIVQMLLENGVAVDPRDNNGWTSLMSASRNGH